MTHILIFFVYCSFQTPLYSDCLGTLKCSFYPLFGIQTCCFSYGFDGFLVFSHFCLALWFSNNVLAFFFLVRTLYMIETDGMDSDEVLHVSFFCMDFCHSLYALNVGI